MINDKRIKRQEPANMPLPFRIPIGIRLIRRAFVLRAFLCRKGRRAALTKGCFDDNIYYT